jgi:hypothetical protein
MTLTCICCTFARPACVNEAVQLFLNQTWSGPKQLILLNSFPKQRFKFDHPDVLVVNLLERPASLGQARNQAISYAQEDSLIITTDDDDFITSWHLANYAENLEPDCMWYWLSAEYYSENRRIKSVAMGTPNLFAFTKKAWKSVGGYPALTVGEDRALMSKISPKFKGKKITLATNRISFIRGWGADELYHTSGLGDDRTGRQSSHERVAEHAEDLIRRGLLATGEIQIVPKANADYDKLALDFSGAICRVQDQKWGKVAVLELGRYGDILNILPVCKYIAEHYEKPLLAVSKEFAPLLDGVSYVTPLPLDLPYDKVNQAMTICRQKAELVICAQVYGESYNPEKLRPCYSWDSWQQAGFGELYMDKWTHPLVIDRRDRLREDNFARSKLSSKPTILLNISRGISSPYNDHAKFTELLRTNWSEKYHIVDIGQTNAQQICDLLGMYDKAALLITSDTATLHLAAASDIPVIALVNDIDWLATIPRCNCVYRVRYCDAVQNFAVVNMTIDNLAKVKRCAIRPPKPFVKPKRRIVHAVEWHPELADDPRKSKARESWKALYAQGVIQTPYAVYKRNSGELGCRRSLPFLKDVLAHGLASADDPNDIVFWTNDDNILHPRLPLALEMHLSIFDACTSQRREFSKPYPTTPVTPDEVVAMSEDHLGRDLFAATAGWLRRYWNEIPDFLLGVPVFDLCLAAMVRSKRGFKTDRNNIATNYAPCELRLGYVSHERHPSFWNTLPASDPATQHNHNEFRKWAEKFAPEMRLPL